MPTTKPRAKPLPRVRLGRRRRRSRLGATRSIWLLTAAIAGIAAAIYLLLLRDVQGLDASVHLRWWALAPAFAVAELCVVHVHFRRSAHTLTLSELPLVAGLLLASPADLLLGQLLGAGVVIFFSMRKMPLRLAFNLAQFTLVSCVAAGVLDSVAGNGTLDHETWVACFMATVLSGQLAVLLIAAAIRLAEGEFEMTRLPSMLATAAVVSATNAALALAGVVVASNDPVAFVLLAVPSIVVFLAYRAYLSARREHARLEFLHDATKSLANASETTPALDEVLARTLTMFRAEWGEAVLFPAQQGDAPLVLRRDQGVGDGRLQAIDPDVADALQALVDDDPHPIVLDPAKLDGVLADHLAFHGVVSAVLAPLPGETRLVGTIMLANRVGVDAPYRSEELRLFETLSRQAGSWLEHDRLEQTVWRLSELKAELEHQAFHDPLTGLANRSLFSRRVEEALAADAGHVAVLFLDLDEFKQVNDTLGHTAGDTLLHAVALRLLGAVPEAGLAARLGGDEFAVLLTGADAAVADGIADLVTASLLAPVRVGPHDLQVHGSLGLAVTTAEDLVDAEELLRRADVAMYAAKARGRRQVARYDPALHDEVVRRHKLATELDRAIARGEFVTHFQPIVDLATERVIGVEALVRWQSPERGLVPPGVFIGVAEESSLIVQIGRHVLDDACGKLAELERVLETPDLALHVNLSALEFAQPDLVERVAEVVERHRVPPHQLVLEVTETAVMQRGGQGVDTLRRLRALGLRLALDDFGTGWSSLGSLRDLPLDIVKIAKPFIDDIATQHEATAFVRMMLELFGTLGLPVVAEGIEESDQGLILQQLQCSMAQGYFYGRPVAIEQLGNRAQLAA